MEFGPDSGGYETSEREERSRWQRIVAATLLELPDQPRAFAELWEHFSTASSWRLYPDVEPALRSIKALGWRLGVGSNFDSRLRAILGSFSVTEELDALLISSEVGWRKPHPDFYQSVPRTLELEPREIVWIGDSPAHDLIGPQEVGFQAILLDRTARYPDLSPRIGTLGEVGNFG
jgi:putative hydrolase of the HAD superfamily